MTPDAEALYQRDKQRAEELRRPPAPPTRPPGPTPPLRRPLPRVGDNGKFVGYPGDDATPEKWKEWNRATPVGTLPRRERRRQFLVRLLFFTLLGGTALFALAAGLIQHFTPAVPPSPHVVKAPPLPTHPAAHKALHRHSH